MPEKLTNKEVNCWEAFLVGEPHSEKPEADSIKHCEVGGEQREDTITSLPFDCR